MYTEHLKPPWQLASDYEKLSVILLNIIIYPPCSQHSQIPISLE